MGAYEDVNALAMVMRSEGGIRRKGIRGAHNMRRRMHACQRFGHGHEV
jgi:hypothetical protein